MTSLPASSSQMKEEDDESNETDSLQNGCYFGYDE